MPLDRSPFSLRAWRALRAAAWLVCGLLWCAPAFAAPTDAKGPAHTEIYFVSIGPGDHLYTRGGHAALMVAQMVGEQVIESAVYNYGDADWEDPMLPWRFFRGTLQFRLDRPGDMLAVADDYGVQQNRDVFVQRIALTPTQVQQVATVLETTVAPDKRDYPYHYVRSICSTKVRDVLDEAVGGAISTQLGGQPDALTIREYQRLAFNGHPLQAAAADLFLGRANDVEIDKWFALFVPARMRAELQAVRVPDPAGSGARVPLAEPAQQIAGRDGHAPSGSATWGSAWIFVPLFAGFGLAAARVRRIADAQQAAVEVGRWFVWWCAITGALSVLIAAVMLFSGVTELRVNEMILSFWPLDLLLLRPALRLRAGASAQGLRMFGRLRVRSYVHGRVVMLGLILAAHAPGWLVQPLGPTVYVFAGFVLGGALLRRVCD